MAIDRMDHDPDRVQDQETVEEYLTFHIDNRIYGVNIKYVADINSIFEVLPITQLPAVPPYISGVFNLRSKIIPAMDIRVKFNLPPAEYTKRTCVISIEVGDAIVGLIVDSVAEVLTINPEQVVAQPSDELMMSRQYITGTVVIGDEVTMLLDCEHLLEN